MSIRGTHVPFEPIFIFQRFNKKHLLKSFSPRSHVDKRNPLFPLNRYFIFKHLDGKTLPKAQRTQGLSSYHKFLHKSWSNLNFSILKHRILTKASFRILTWPKIKLRYVNQKSAAKYQPNFSFKILPELQLQILTKISPQNLNKSFALWSNLSYQICNKLLPTRSFSSTSATVTTSTSFE